MNIDFYLNNEDETHIVSIEQESDPFYVADQIWLSVNELYPTKLKEFRRETQISLLEKEKEFQSKFHNKKIELLKKSKHLRFDVLGNAVVTIEYICKLI